MEEKKWSVVFSRRLPQNPNNEDMIRIIHHIQERAEFEFQKLNKKYIELEQRVRELEGS